MVNFDDVIKRLLEIKGKSQGKEAAQLLGISPADLSNRKKRGTLLPLLIEWAMQEEVNLHWFITGEGPERLEAVPQNRQFDMLNEFEVWLNEEVRRNPERKIWFELHLLDSFQKFAEWRRKRDEQESGEVEGSKRKVA